MPEFLKKALSERRTVTVFVTNGFKMVGILVDVDTEFRAITLDVDGKERLVFMNAVSTII